MNPLLNQLKPYPFERLRQLLADAKPTHQYEQPINLSIGEPKHATPPIIKEAIMANLNGLASYPATKGSLALRTTIAQWIARRYDIDTPNPDTQVLPCLGSREALFSFIQTLLTGEQDSIVVCPNPFYQIYEGASYLGGATPYFVNASLDHPFTHEWESIPESVWQKTQLLIVCSPDNPTGRVVSLAEWQYLFELSDKYNFIIASDECYSEIYFDQKPLGILQAATLCGRSDYHRMICFSSLSKRSNVPGMRSGFVAGDEKLIKPFLLYRTYHGSAMSDVVAAASIVAWQDEEHVKQNRILYQEKFKHVFPILKPVLDVTMPEASFYLWAGTPIADTDFVKALYEHANVTLLPGSFLSRENTAGINPGKNRVRIALVAPIEECIEGAKRIAQFVKTMKIG
ncbi:succinyldiaminopimelate transaminase [Pelistega ratti]|uniref:succinyldiaminopimelate transaminase n=1 Tax=Pelistega ratti TaxID=2652177 RepID=UPI00135AB0A7|nr:succinyldiaminopimelate transaminase [Pelistega ratti]